MFAGKCISERGGERKPGGMRRSGLMGEIEPSRLMGLFCGGGKCLRGCYWGCGCAGSSGAGVERAGEDAIDVDVDVDVYAGGAGG